MLRYLYDLSFQVFYPHYNDKKYALTLQCPNLDNQLTLSLLHNASVQGGIHYHDVCKVADSVTIAYNEYHPYFFVWRGTQIMVEYTLSPEKGVLSQMALDWEIIKPFFDHYSLTPTWVNCNNTYGVLDEETGTWTGAVGKVRNCNLVNRSIRSHFCNFEF